MFWRYIVSTFLLLSTDVVLCKPDYLYNLAVDGWLKVHPIPATWKEAFQRCYYEGAVLASPLSKELLTALHAEITNSPVDLPIFLGVHALYSEINFFSVEGVPLENMAIKWGKHGLGAKTGDCLTMDNVGPMFYVNRSACTEAHPYICFKKRENNTRLNACGTFDNNYRLDKRTGSCYKLHKEKKVWSQAHMICAAEGGYLVVLNNEEEASIVKNMFPQYKSADIWEPMHIGLRDLSNDGTWITIHGEPVENVFHTWAPGQPDNNQNNQFCGDFVRKGFIDDGYCHMKTIFVCEKDPNTIRLGALDMKYEAILFSDEIR